MGQTTKMIEELRALEAKASPGPWMRDSIKNVGRNWCIGIIDCGDDSRLDNARQIVTTDSIRASGMVSGSAGQDAEFIAAARNALVPLLHEIERLQEALREWLALAEHQGLSTSSHRRRTQEVLGEERP